MIFTRDFIKIGECISILRIEDSKDGQPAGSPIIDDYVRVRFEGLFWSAHRLSYHLNIKKLPFKLKDRKEGQVLHTCDNKWRINPDHIYLGTAKQNAADRSNRSIRDNLGCGLKGRKHSKERKEKQSLALRGNANKKGKKHSIESRLNMSESHIGIKEPSSVREKKRISGLRFWGSTTEQQRRNRTIAACKASANRRSQNNG